MTKAVRVKSSEYEERVNILIKEGWTVQHMTCSSPAGGSISREVEVFLIVTNFNGKVA
jgi:hypothetical protein